MFQCPRCRAKQVIIRDGEYAYCVNCAWQTHPVRRPNREFDHPPCDRCAPAPHVVFKHSRTAEAHRMRTLGYDLLDIAHNLHVSPRQTQRYLAQDVVCGWSRPLCAHCAVR